MVGIWSLRGISVIDVVHVFPSLGPTTRSTLVAVIADSLELFVRVEGLYLLLSVVAAGRRLVVRLFRNCGVVVGSPPE